MKSFLIIIGCVLFLLSCTSVTKKEVGRTNADTINKLDRAFFFKDTAINDTFFLYRNVEGLYHAIYLEKNRNIEFNRLTNFVFDDLDSSGYNGAWEANRQKFGQPTKVNLGSFPMEWIPLQVYRGNHYLYAPSDWGAAGKRILADSAFVYWYMTGPWPEYWAGFKKINDNTFELTTWSATSENRETTTILIHILDPKKMITLWEYKHSGKTDYGFYIPKEKAGAFDMIVNYCDSQKQPEYDFEKVDYTKLISPK